MEFGNLLLTSEEINMAFIDIYTCMYMHIHISMYVHVCVHLCFSFL